MGSFLTGEIPPSASSVPVSYTHLDVYKRQMYLRVVGHKRVGGSLNRLKAGTLGKGMPEGNVSLQLVGLGTRGLAGGRLRAGRLRAGVLGRGICCLLYTSCKQLIAHTSLCLKSDGIKLSAIHAACARIFRVIAVTQFKTEGISALIDMEVSVYLGRIADAEE